MSVVVANEAHRAVIDQMLAPNSVPARVRVVALHIHQFGFARAPNLLSQRLEAYLAAKSTVTLVFGERLFKQESGAPMNSDAEKAIQMYERLEARGAKIWQVGPLGSSSPYMHAKLLLIEAVHEKSINARLLLGSANLTSSAVSGQSSHELGLLFDPVSDVDVLNRVNEFIDHALNSARSFPDVV